VPRRSTGSADDRAMWQTLGMATEIETLCDEVLAARSAREELKNQLATAETAMGEVEDKLAALLASSEEKITHGGFSFTSASKVSWKTVSASKDELLTLLKEGAPELVKETVNAASLNSYLKKNESALEDSNPTWWSSAKDCMERKETQSLSIRKKAKKK
jgi:hypothetical protein